MALGVHNGHFTYQEINVMASCGKDSWDGNCNVERLTQLINGVPCKCITRTWMASATFNHTLANPSTHSLSWYYEPSQNWWFQS